MESLIFDNEYLRQHKLYALCKSSLNEVSERDYPGKNYFSPKIDCLDIDTYETAICNGEKDHTMDAVIGISNCSAQKDISNARLLLVELRMRYKSANGLSRSELEAKVRHTKSLIGNDLRVEPKSIFVFTELVAPQARYWISSLLREGGEIRNFVIWSVNEFNSNVRDVNDMPYTPLYAPNTIATELDKLFIGNQLDGLFVRITYWLGIAEQNRYSNHFEYENIRSAILEEWSKIRTLKSEFDDDEVELRAQILEEDMERILYCA